MNIANGTSVNINKISCGYQHAHLFDSRSLQAALWSLGGHVVVGGGVGGARVFAVVVKVAVTVFYGGKHSPINTDRQQNTEEGLLSLNTPQAMDVLQRPSSPSSSLSPLHPVPVMLSGSWTSWELLLQHSLSSVNSSLPSMLIVCWSPVMPEVWNGPGDRKTDQSVRRVSTMSCSSWRENVRSGGG